MLIRVINKYTFKPNDNSEIEVPIFRGTPLGNPYTHLRGKTLAEFQCKTREESITLYETYLIKKIQDKDQIICKELNRIYNLAKEYNISLVCFCAPKSCHGDIIKRIILEKLNV